MPMHKLWCKKVLLDWHPVTIGAHGYDRISNWCQCYKTISVRDLRIFVLG